ncbi:hypothetical protein C2869_18395 [Saccharobesus litoralis]|uniref:6-phosphogluconolactonase n=1 Tax=Saccharobesus litoralis TaxID=2172099 RepID=A0A2S0VVL8_9ALTE|nr:lactonase family protein [Saccharobesus litoralis]AWB68261.1 hypothetical protein C2869_18395 [Saccharobesus litoralis]
MQKLILSLLSAWLLLIQLPSASAQQNEFYVASGDNGIYRLTINGQKNRLAKPQKVADVNHVGFLTQHPTKAILYAVANHNEAVVMGFTKHKNGQLSMLNSQAINDGQTAGTHLAVHPSGKWLTTVQYRTGSVSVFPLAADGQIKPRSQLIHHQAVKQQGSKKTKPARPHWVGYSPDGRFVFIPDLGQDQIVIYQVTEQGQLQAHGFSQVKKGSGPRHMKFSKDGNFVYLLNELAMTVSVFAYDAQQGTLTAIQDDQATIDEADWRTASRHSASEIRVHANGQLIYTANRGHDSISIFKVSDNGQIKRIANESVRGAEPRNFALDNTGQWLVSAGLASNSLSLFTVDPVSGLLQFQRGQVQAVPKPLCVLFWR